ncbi:hypothetical protein QJS10_CPB22g01233 [Acorus calamus]|uniref:rRNA biogenesis protein RRP5 n=1 Tax=Acorus calamus TaxID=4465 RepID=A0AAV9C194_ACOCL|nr:hypothetical protein QJS10_CPB22g01233 [Acorus calamus]
MKLLGVVAEVNPKDLVISLPGGLRGFVRAEEASDILFDSGTKELENDLLGKLFHASQLVACIVLKVENEKKDGSGSKRIWLSLRLSLLHKGLTLDLIEEGMVMTANIKSHEDHGYILQFGSSSFSGFLPVASGGGVNEMKMNNGQLIQGIVKSIDKARGVVYLNLDRNLVSKCIMKDLKGLTIDLLVPGTMVNARVQSALENGIMLSFLTYFTGSVDIFHLQNSFPSAAWKDDYAQHKKVTARILFIDPSTRAVGLTLNPHLLNYKAPPSNVNTGDIYDNSRIVRVDKRFGLLLELPSIPSPMPSYVSIFDVSDGEVQKLEKKFKVDNLVRVRVLGLRLLEGLAMATLKASALEGSVFTHSDVKPGMLVKGKVIAVESFGAIVQFSSGVKALCPLPHMSELDIVKPPKKFKIGAELLFRVLGCKSKRITVTHKKTLVKSKLNIIASYADATEKLITHGWITKIEKHGCFVRFYNGVQGFAHRSELGLDPGSEPGSVYHVGEVVKCRIISVVSASRRISVSFVTTPKSDSTTGVPKLGSLVSGVVEKVTPMVVVVLLNSSQLKGTISTEHLADFQGHATLLKSLLKPGYKFDELLVLDIEGGNLILSAKYSLICSAQQLPCDVADCIPHSVVHGYICNIIETGCFVRFLGHLTAFSPKNKTADDQIDDLSKAFYVGQSIRGHILNVNTERSRITLSLKQSSCFSTTGSLIEGYFLLEEKIAGLQITESSDSGVTWMKKFSIGSIVKGKIQEIKEFGAVVSFKDHSNILGFITQYQLGGKNVEEGNVVEAVVLDINKADGLVDLSLRSELFSKTKDVKSDSLESKKKRRREPCVDLELHQTVTAVVEIVKEFYLVLSLPEHKCAIGYASITDYNIQKLPHKQFTNGQRVIASVEALPTLSSSGRFLLLLKSMSEVSETSSSKRSKKNSRFSVGSIIEAEITDIKPLEMKLRFNMFHGRVHITEVFDNYVMKNPFSEFNIGQLVVARIVSKAQHSGGSSGKGYQWELSMKPSVIAGTQDINEDPSLSVGATVTGYVVKLDKEWVWLTVARHFSAQLFVLDTSCEPSELQEFQKHYIVGQAVSGKILSINKEKKLLRLIPPLREAPIDHHIINVDAPETKGSDESATGHIHAGDIVGGRIAKVLPGVGGLLVQIGPHFYGKVHYTELRDMWVSDPLSGYEEGHFVKCKVLEISRSFKGTTHVNLSLRAGFYSSDNLKIEGLQNSSDGLGQRYEKFEDLHRGMTVQGYVKSVTPKGCFVMLSRNIDARILLSNLSNGFIENLAEEFPVGKLINGRVSFVDASSKRVELTLKTADGDRRAKSDMSGLRSLHAGDLVSGQIKRIESFGLFITIDHTNVVGLCHISELSDDSVENIESTYCVGEKVKVKILKVDEEKCRVSLGMKNSYLQNNPSDAMLFPFGIDGDDNIHASTHLMQCNGNLANIGDACESLANGVCLGPIQAESRTSVLPLEVPLEDTDGSDADDVTVTDVHTNKPDIFTEREQKKAKKKAKEQREHEIKASEDRLLGDDIPRSEDEFEKSVRCSPNSSFVWIKYMAFMLSQDEVQKARSIAERALSTINIREEGEKLNIWVAYLNLENEYGKPPEEAVMKIFQRALQICDPKKLHLALLGMYERTEQHKLADELLEKMTKKFKKSCKVWLRRVQNVLKQGKDEVQAVVNRAALSLPRNKHIKFLSQAAILEFKCGEPNRGRSLFEGMLKEYPKRTDLWSIYLDQEFRIGDKDVIRALFERATCLSLPPKKMKFIFKKYLEYEKSLGGEGQVEYVKRKAMEFVESSVA